MEDAEFQTFVKLLCPGYNLPSRKTISESLMPQLYESTLDSVKSSINEAFAVCVTTDGWTSIDNRSFLAVTAHWINKRAELKSNLLECLVFNDQHTSENLCNFLKDVFNKWKIGNKIVSVVTDNAANIVCAVRYEGWRHFPCFAHTINLVVHNGLKTIKPTVDKIKGVVEFFKRSSQALVKLRNIKNKWDFQK